MEEQDVLAAGQLPGGPVGPMQAAGHHVHPGAPGTRPTILRGREAHVGPEMLVVLRPLQQPELATMPTTFRLAPRSRYFFSRNHVNTDISCIIRDIYQSSKNILMGKPIYVHSLSIIGIYTGSL